MKVLRNYLYNTGYQILAIILPLITSPYVSRRLMPKGIGIYSYTYSIVQYFVLLAGLGISFYGSREIAYVRNNKEKLSKTFWEIIFIEIVTVSISLSCFVLFSFVYGKNTRYFLYQSFYIIAVLFDIAWFFSGLEDFKKIVIRNSLVKLLTAVSIFILIRNNNDTGKYILILSLGTLLGNLTFWPYIRNIVNFVQIKSLSPLRLLPSIIALFIPQIAIQIYTQLDKTLLGSLDSTEAAGYYNYSDSIVRMSLTLITSVSAVMLPHISNAFSNGQKERVYNLTIKSFDIISFLAVGMAFGLAAISLKFAPFFYGQQFKPVGVAMFFESIAIIPIAWASIIGNQFLVATKKMAIYNKSVFLGLIFNIFFGIFLIKYAGLIGASIVTVLSEFVVTGYQLFSVNKYFDYKVLFQNIFKYFISGLLMFIVVFLVTLRFDMNILSLVIEILLGIIIYFGLNYIQKPSVFLLINSVLKNQNH